MREKNIKKRQSLTKDSIYKGNNLILCFVSFVFVFQSLLNEWTVNTNLNVLQNVDGKRLLNIVSPNHEIRETVRKSSPWNQNQFQNLYKMKKHLLKAAATATLNSDSISAKQTVNDLGIV